MDIYLSPHLDDAVLSCGGRIWQRAQAGGRVVVVTVFASAPEPDVVLSPFAQALHARWGFDRRHEEDLEALARLGAEAVHWPYADCIYRRDPQGNLPYASEDALWEEIHPSEEALIEEITLRIADWPLAREGLLYTPLAVGHHVDHRIVRQAAERSGRALVYYEDFPYAQDVEAVQEALGENERWRSMTVSLSEEALEAKIAAIAQYRSQVSTFWDSRDEMVAAVRTFAKQRGCEEPVERYWLPTTVD